MKRSVLNSIFFKKYLLLAIVGILSVSSFAQTASDTLDEIPELVFRNPVLFSGKSGKEGAVYKFAKVAPGIDARILLKKFSDPAIKVANIDNSSYGFDKAFQPEFGMDPVKKRQNWYIDFELTFWDAGTNNKRSIDKFTVTSLDVDGDGFNVQEYVTMQKATSVTYSTISYLTNGNSVTTPPLPTCGKCGKQSAAITCPTCKGTGVDPSYMGKGKPKKCTTCQGVGQVYSLCGHPFDGQDISIKGPEDNFSNIDTSATSVMATYIYNNKDAIDFRVGATSGSRDGGAGVRLNSMWFKGFNLAPSSTLPVKLNSFNALLDKSNVLLSWSALEQNFNHYVLQRSTDGRNYSDVAVVFASDDIKARDNYSYKDNNVSSATGTLFYRLQLIDKTAEATFSSVRVIKLEKEKETLSITTYPNPVTDQVRVTFPSSWQGKTVSIELYSSNGVRVQNVQVGSASQTETMMISKISKGFYLIKAICNGEVAQQRIIKN